MNRLGRPGVGKFQVANNEMPGDAIAKLEEVGKEFSELLPEERELGAKPEG